MDNAPIPTSTAGNDQGDETSLSAPPSPTPSTVSLSNSEYSYSSSVNRDFVIKEMFGRSINSTSEVCFTNPVLGSIDSESPALHFARSARILNFFWQL